MLSKWAPGSRRHLRAGVPKKLRTLLPVVSSLNMAGAISWGGFVG
jgi:hypothetical protein